MKEEEVLKLLLIQYGYGRYINVKIENCGLYTSYDVCGVNLDGDMYHKTATSFNFAMQDIIDYMSRHEIKPYGFCGVLKEETSSLLDDYKREEYNYEYDVDKYYDELKENSIKEHKIEKVPNNICSFCSNCTKNIFTCEIHKEWKRKRKEYSSKVDELEKKLHNFWLSKAKDKADENVRKIKDIVSGKTIVSMEMSRPMGKIIYVEPKYSR